MPRKPLTKEQFIERAYLAHGDLYSYEATNYHRTNQKVSVICRKEFHGEFFMTPNDHLKGKGCPRCRGSRGEHALQRFIIESGVEFIREYYLETGATSQRLDFFLPSRDIGIEIQGDHHYFSDNPWGTEFSDIVARDQRKRELCKSLGIKLISIPYLKSNTKKMLNAAERRLGDYLG